MVDSVETDARSISLVDDILSTSVPELSTKLHFRHFHDDANDLSVSTLIDGTQSSGTTWIADNIDFVMRDKKGRAPDDGSSSDLTS